MSGQCEHVNPYKWCAGTRVGERCARDPEARCREKCPTCRRWRKYGPWCRYCDETL